MKKRGRPPLPAKDKLRNRVEVLFTDEQERLINKASRLRNTDKSKRIRELAVRDAKRTIAKHT
ncbi:MAG: hypothetical protein EBV86_02285 [Marivivens sp.]|nr:hypothetical protein [Marivivens sp.]NCW67385.1 hypothetical protein [Marivivens sp.]